jgi:cytochrome c553
MQPLSTSFPRTLLCATIAWFVQSFPCRSEDGLAFFEKRIRPVLVKHCYECHSAESKKLKGGLRLDSVAHLLQGGESGPLLVKGRAKESLLIEALNYESGEMPPSGKLPAQIIADFERWIEIGAPAPQDSAEPTVVAPKEIDFTAARTHWAYQPLRTTPVPKAAPSVAWAKRDLDHFLFDALATHALCPAPPADATMILRRVSFDLTGLPPDYEDVVRFVADPSDEAYAEYVEKLLASQAYGEHWGRQWMDVVRYADTNPTSEGSNKPEPFAFGYRDWIIDALNRDVPYDRFITYQLAADSMGAEGTEHLAALGFVSLGLTYHKDLNLDRDVIETLAMDDWDDRVDTLSRGLLGLTVSCARCHDHKFDAISQADYYGLAGVFASVHGVRRVLDGGDTKGLEAKLSEVERLKEEAFKLRNKDPAREKELNQESAQLFNSVVGENAGKVVFALEEGGTWYDRGDAKTVPVFRRGEMRDLPVYVRGSVQSPGATVPRRFLLLFTDGKAVPFAHGSGRRELAEGLFSKNTAPLTARVIANRMWGWHFGQHLVSTPSDFGVMGDPPTHPQLLDYLAEFLIANRWSLKALHREIVLSATYRQSAQPSADAAARDGANRFFSHYPVRRLSAEQYRDSILKSAGSLAEVQQRGRGFDWSRDQMGDLTRRSVYARLNRPALPTYLIQFNFPDPMLHSPARVPVTSATQNLFLLNAPSMIDIAQAIASRLRGKTDEEFLGQAFRTLFFREPDASERQRYLAQLRDWKATSDQAEAGLIHALLITNEYLYLR